MITNASGGTITFTATTVTLGSVNEEDKDLLITAGLTEDCNDVGLAFDADGLFTGSIDCDFSVFVGDMNPDDIDGEMMTTERPVPAMPVVIR
mmetsp:Transcript_11231/g.12349  ORF Transcript_11231/g.12349 Transcript_11231/m.12349 type:complete len:92 (-) Transcript_11231:92-367(-)